MCLLWPLVSSTVKSSALIYIQVVVFYLYILFLGTSNTSVGIFHIFCLLVHEYSLCLIDEFFSTNTNYCLDIFRTSYLFNYFYFDYSILVPLFYINWFFFKLRISYLISLSLCHKLLPCFEIYTMCHFPFEHGHNY